MATAKTATPARKKISPASTPGAQAAVTSAEIKQPEKLAANEGVLVIVPQGFKLTDRVKGIIDYPMGTYRMPKDHADHWYAQAHGVKEVD